MKALVLKELNSQLSYEEVELQTPGEGEVAINMKAAALNRRDIWIKYGQYPGIVLPAILGSDGVGEYEGNDFIINPNINWRTDDRFPDYNYEILGLGYRGTFAEQIVVNLDRLVPKPSHLSKVQAAALPLGGLTAYRALFNQQKGSLRESQKVLIIGAGSGAALFTLQFALAIGAEVYVTSSFDEKIERAKKLGAVGGVNYTQKAWEKNLKSMAAGFDVIIDGAGGVDFTKLAKLCNRGAHVVFYGSAAGFWQNVDALRLFLKQITLAGSTMGSDAEFESMVA